eukprot:m.129856 g.129856  ORF g.129856 m.129856 type:complete len:236 (-) comp19959_c0_seq2:58-765(-)
MSRQSPSFHLKKFPSVRHFLIYCFFVVLAVQCVSVVLVQNFTFAFFLSNDKTTAEAAVAAKDDASKDTTALKEKKPPSGKRFIVFVGNLSYSTTADDIRKHFKCCGEGLSAVRMLTKKGTNEPRGCCFLEFSDKASHSKALLLHWSQLGGRKINVELTAGGGGNTEERVKKIQEKNRLLQEKNAILAKIKDHQEKKQLQKASEDPNKKAASATAAASAENMSRRRKRQPEEAPEG